MEAIATIFEEKVATSQKSIKTVKCRFLVGMNARLEPQFTMQLETVYLCTTVVKFAATQQFVIAPKVGVGGKCNL